MVLVRNTEANGVTTPYAEAFEDTRSPPLSSLIGAAPKESVGSWPMAITILDTFGGTPAYR